jgi:HK97 family phage major capsid protein
VPTEFESSIIMLAYQQAEIRPYADVGTTSRDSVIMPALKRPAFAWSRRGVDITAQALATGAERMPINELTGLMLISNDTLEDADANIYAELSNAFGPGLAEEEDEAFAIGIGDDSPEGVVASTAVQALYKPSGVSTLLSDSTHNGMDALITAYGALKKAYRSTSVWAMNSVTEAAVRMLKTGEGVYLWQPNSQADKPPTLLGRPVINPEGMPAIGAGAFPIVIGSFQRGYRIRDRRGLTVQRLVEKYAEKRQTGFLVTRRLGGQVVVPEAFVPIKIAAS